MSDQPILIGTVQDNSERKRADGIPPSEQDRLFDRFYRARAATEQAIQGTGLGLSIAKAIVEGHGGAIAVESTEGQGTTFRVELPLAPHAAA